MSTSKQPQKKCAWRSDQAVVHHQNRTTYVEVVAAFVVVAASVLLGDAFVVVAA